MTDLALQGPSVVRPTGTYAAVAPSGAGAPLWASAPPPEQAPGLDVCGVVVGMDGSASSRRALRWAAYWAHLHRQRVRVVGAVERPTDRHTAGSVWHRMVHTVEREVALVSARYPRLRIETLTAAGSPQQVLADASRSAWTVVVGTRGLHPANTRVPGSVSAAAVGLAHSPVIVVPSRLAKVTAGGPVVLGCDGSPRTVEATAFAFACADRLRVPLQVADTRQTSRPGLPPEPEAVAALLAGFERVYPHVRCRTLAPASDIVSTLGAGATDATLVVVGAPFADRGSQTGAPERLQLLHRARRPVAFVGSFGP